VYKIPCKTGTKSALEKQVDPITDCFLMNLCN